MQQESSTHKLRSAMRFLQHLHQEIELAEKLEDIKDKLVLNKFEEYILVLKEELKEKI